jgi:hypothetical protein
MEINSGIAELDRKVEDWLKWDKVCIDQSISVVFVEFKLSNF